MRRRFLGALASAGGVSFVLSLSSNALACGGFWCSQIAPVEQTREDIIFVANTDATTTCVVQIQYQGPSEKFAWVLPVQGVPKVDVGASMGFQRLDAATSPRFELTPHVEGTCKQPMYFGYGGAAASYPGAAVDASAAEPQISVLAEGSVGPYDYVVIRPNASLSDPAQVAVDWLKKEGFDITGITGDVLGPYLADGQNLIAFRLTKGQPAGAIRPVILTYAGDLPSIPIRPTAVAAQDDMGVLVYVAGGHQAVPKNYRSLVINETLVNWFNPYSNYDAVVTAAGNQAGGQGFVTELAGPSSLVANLVFLPNDGATLERLRNQPPGDPIDLLFAANDAYRFYDGWKEAIVASLTLPPGVTLDEFNGNPNGVAAMPGFAFDQKAFLDHLESDVVAPVRKMQELLDSRPYLTRLYTTMSPGEMTQDPVFTFNADLAPVSNVHRADIYYECNPETYQYEAPYRIEFPQGGTLRGKGQQQWPLQSSGPAPANTKVVQLSESGSGEVVKDNTKEVFGALVDKGGATMPLPTMPDGPDGGMQIGGPPTMVPVAGTPGPSSSKHDSDGCAVRSPATEARSGLYATLIALVGVALTRRRNRRP